MTRKQHKNTFGVIGYGRFGRLWARELAREGSVLVYDSQKAKRKATPRGVSFARLSDVAKVDFLFLAVPISNLADCLTKIKPYVRPGTLVLDTCSVKVEPVRLMKRILRKSQPVLATHPLFGPDSAGTNGSIRGFKIVVCGVHKNPHLERTILSVFRKLSLRVIHTTPEEHDRDMARSQALVHFMGRALAGLRLGPRLISTPDYQALLRMQDMVVNDTWQLFSDMQSRNRFAPVLREKFIKNLETLEMKMLDSGDIHALRSALDTIDEKILSFLSLRATLSRKIGIAKRIQGRSVYDPARERRLAVLHRSLGRRLGLDPVFVEKLFALIITNSKDIQKT